MNKLSINKTSSRKVPDAVWIVLAVLVLLCGGWYFTRSFVAAAYSLPTSSMEKTIHRGGNVLVRKINYLPISRGDILVFHFPVGDTVINLPEYQSTQPYYDVIRQLGAGNPDAGRQIVLGDPNSYPLVIRPIEERENYLKRCIAAPGETFEMRNEQLFINGQQFAWPETAETFFRVVTNGQPFDETSMKTQYDVDMSGGDDVRASDSANTYMMLLTWKASKKMMADGFAKRITLDIDSDENVFPYDKSIHWSRDNYGPVLVPKKGQSIPLTTQNYQVYERAIRTYEGNKLEMRDGKIFINDHEANSYTFRMNYYWTIGDNLHGSQDSRYWGFVPEDHLIGKVTKIL